MVSCTSTVQLLASNSGLYGPGPCCTPALLACELIGHTLLHSKETFFSAGQVHNAWHHRCSNSCIKKAVCADLHNAELGGVFMQCDEVHK